MIKLCLCLCLKAQFISSESKTKGLFLKLAKHPTQIYVKINNIMYSYNKMKRKFSEISNQENEYKTKNISNKHSV